MRSYDLPETDYLTAKQAQQAINQLNANALSDREHPLLFSGHPQHQDFLKFSTQLHRTLCEAEADEKDAAAAAKLEDARAVTGELTAQQCMDRGRALLKTKGYLCGEMEPEKRAALKKEIDSCFFVGCQPEPEPEPSTPDAEEDSDA